MSHRSVHRRCARATVVAVGVVAAFLALALGWAPDAEAGGGPTSTQAPTTRSPTTPVPTTASPTSPPPTTGAASTPVTEAGPTSSVPDAEGRTSASTVVYEVTVRDDDPPLLYASIGVAVVLLIGILWYFVFRSRSGEASSGEGGADGA